MPKPDKASLSDMPVQFNHTIVHAKNKELSANFLTEILGLPPPKKFMHFLVVVTANGASLDYLETTDDFDKQHYSFLVSEAEFDEIFGRIKNKKLKYWADPARSNEGQTYKFNEGRGVYFEDPSGHFMEIQTRPYF